MTNTSRVVLGIGCAMAAGVLVGMLFAPSKGSELRQQIKDKTTDLLDKGKNLLTKKREEIREALV